MSWAVRHDGTNFRAIGSAEDLLEGEAFSERQPDIIVASPEQLIAQERFQREISGAIVNGFAVMTDRETQSKLSAASLRAQRTPDYVVDWKLADGSFATLDAPSIISLADGVDDYVQACYSRERDLLEALSSGGFTREMLSIGWPLSGSGLENSDNP
ncbi:hypothetical protein AUC61_23860 [Pseudomonas sp. S25]|uniref:DUF4376 domain-containing protein n=1 Tax=Pseudomonas maioricensis TaxID=1766623 RepID=A0ABS9ZQI4_9PSED|nr:DUF4376 domain-containing protein [Pseudomonas sp. S25]MCI8212571.1 hypothetical protein [Pseudomonas sp. S25]